MVTRDPSIPPGLPRWAEQRVGSRVLRVGVSGHDAGRSVPSNASRVSAAGIRRRYLRAISEWFFKVEALGVEMEQKILGELMRYEGLPPPDFLSVPYSRAWVHWIQILITEDPEQALTFWRTQKLDATKFLKTAKIYGRRITREQRAWILRQ